MQTIRSLLFSFLLLVAFIPSLSADKLLNLVKKNKYGDIKKYLKTTEGKKEVNTPDKDNKTPLYEACLNNNFDIAELLLRYGAKDSINIPDKIDFRTPLYLACCSNNLKLVRLLLQNGAKDSVNNPDETKKTPLWWSCHNGNPEIVKLLLQNSADATIKPLYFQSPISIICSHQWNTLHQWNTQQRKELLMSFIPFKKNGNKTQKQKDVKDFIELVIAALAEQMEKTGLMGNCPSAPNIQETSKLFSHPSVPNQKEEINRIEEFTKILLFQPHKTYTWPEKPINRNHPAHFDCSTDEYRLKFNFGINYSQYLFLRALQQTTHKAILAQKKSILPAKKKQFSKLSDVVIICDKPRKYESTVSFEDMTNMYNEN